jgi:hypothetical protein
MSANEQVLNTGNQAITNYDTSKIFLWNNRYINAPFTAEGYDDTTLLAGTVMGRVASTNEVVPMESNASDGSQFPIGILAKDYNIAGGDTVDLAICVGGDVAEEKVLFARNGDGFSTVVSSRTIRDRIAGDTLGIKLVLGTEMTAFDNQ